MDSENCQSNCQFAGTNKKVVVVMCCPELRKARGHKIQGDLDPFLAEPLRDPPHLLLGLECCACPPSY